MTPTRALIVFLKRKNLARKCELEACAFAGAVLSKNGEFSFHGFGKAFAESETWTNAGLGVRSFFGGFVEGLEEELLLRACNAITLIADLDVDFLVFDL